MQCFSIAHSLSLTTTADFGQASAILRTADNQQDFKMKSRGSDSGCPYSLGSQYILVMNQATSRTSHQCPILKVQNTNDISSDNQCPLLDQYKKIKCHSLANFECYDTLNPCPRRPASAKRRVVFPELGGPKSSVNLETIEQGKASIEQKSSVLNSIMTLCSTRSTWKVLQSH